MYDRHQFGDDVASVNRAKVVKTLILALALITVNLGITRLNWASHESNPKVFERSDSHRRVTNRHLLEHVVAANLSKYAVKPTDQQGTNKEDECSALKEVENSRKCDFIKTTPDCDQSDGFLQYLQFPYCILPHVTALAFVLMFLWLVFLFIVLGTTADEYFCQSLSVISKTLGLSQNVAGVTFLAYGNGSPDIFSALAAFQDENGAQLGIQALFGAGMFVTTIVVGVVAFTSRLELTNRPFTRDVLFYLGAVAWTFITLYKQTITLKESIGFIAFYVVYVIVVIAGRLIYQRYMKPRTNPTVVISASSNEVNERRLTGFAGSPNVEGEDPFRSINPTEEKRSADIENSDLTSSSRIQHHTISDALFATETTLVASALHDAPEPPSVLSRENSIERDDEETPLLGYRRSRASHFRKFLVALLPIDLEEWRQCGVLWKMFLICKAPAVFFLNISIPVVDYDEDDQHWNKWLNVLHCITGPMFCIFATKVNSTLLADRFPVWALTLCIVVILALVVALTTKHDTPPRSHWLFAYMAFFVSVIWIYSTANEIVNLLQSFGLVFGLSDAILGLTFLAWGNSIGDFVSNTAMARQGFPQMAVSACYGGPLLNMLLGIGISCTVATIKRGHALPLPHTSHQYLVSAGFLAASLSSSAIVIPLLGFRVPRAYGVYLITLYIAYLIASVVVEVKKI